MPLSYSPSEDLPDGAGLYALREPAHVPAGPAHKGMSMYTVLYTITTTAVYYYYSYFFCACYIVLFIL